jgi:hypothetical protein
MMIVKMAAEALIDRIFSGSTADVQSKIDNVNIIAKRMIWADMLKDARHVKPSIGARADLLLGISIKRISNCVRPYATHGLESLIAKIKAECREFALLEYALQEIQLGFFTREKTSSSGTVRPSAPEVEGIYTFIPLSHVTDGFHDSGYGPKRLREKTAALPAIREWNGFSAKYDEGPRALYYTVGDPSARNIEVSLTDRIINRNLVLDGDMLKILGLETYLDSIIGIWRGPGGGAGPGTTHLTIRTIDNGTIEFAVKDGHEEIEIIQIIYPTVCSTASLEAYFRSIAPTFFMGNPTKNAWFNANPDITPINRSIAEWFLLCKFLGDALQVIECKVKMGTNADSIFTHCMFTGDEFVSGRGDILGEPNMCKSAMIKEFKNIGKGTYSTPQTNKLKFAIEHVKLAVYGVIDNNNIEIARIGEIINGTTLIDFNTASLESATPSIVEYLTSIIDAIIYVNTILELNFKKVSEITSRVEAMPAGEDAETEADAIIEEMLALENFAKLGQSLKILRINSNGTAVILPTKNLFPAASEKTGQFSFSNIDDTFTEKYIGPIEPFQGMPYERVYVGIETIPHPPPFDGNNLETILNPNRNGKKGFDIILNNNVRGKNSNNIRLQMFKLRTVSERNNPSRGPRDSTARSMPLTSMQAMQETEAAQAASSQSEREQLQENIIASIAGRSEAANAFVEMDAAAAASSSAASSSYKMEGGRRKQKGGQEDDATIDDRHPSIIFYNKIKHILQCIIKNRKKNFEKVRFTSIYPDVELHPIYRNYTIASYELTHEMLALFIESCYFSWDELEGNVALYFIEIVSLSFYTEYTEYFNRIGYTCLDEDVLQYFLCKYIINSASSYSKGVDIPMTIDRFSIEFFNRPLPYLSLFDDVMELKMIKVKPRVSIRFDDIRSTKYKIFEHLNHMNHTRFEKRTRQYQEQDRVDVEDYKKAMHKLEMMKVSHKKSIHHRSTSHPPNRSHAHLKRSHKRTVQRSVRRKGRTVRKGSHPTIHTFRRATIKRHSPAQRSHTVHEISRRGGAHASRRNRTQKRR